MIRSKPREKQASFFSRSCTCTQLEWESCECACRDARNAVLAAEGEFAGIQAHTLRPTVSQCYCSGHDPCCAGRTTRRLVSQCFSSSVRACVKRRLKAMSTDAVHKRVKMEAWHVIRLLRRNESKRKRNRCRMLGAREMATNPMAKWLARMSCKILSSGCGTLCSLPSPADRQEALGQYPRHIGTLLCNSQAATHFKSCLEMDFGRAQRLHGR